MKTLRQIREECNHIPNTDTLNEATGKKHAEKSAGFPNMPSMLLFKRVTYRIYPNNQLVALYYSRMIDKYLTIPFSKEGVLQMKEGVIHDSLDEGWNLEEETITTKVDCREAFRQKLDEKRQEKLDEFLPLAAIRSAGAAVLKKVGKNIIGKMLGGDDQKSKQQEPSKLSKAGDVKLSSVKTSSSFKERKPAPTPVQENKIANIRKMVKENVESIDLVINGKPITLNTNMAKRIVEVYDSVNSKNKKIVENMLNEDLESFKKLLNFSIRN